jgi:hypothetical protein
MDGRLISDVGTGVDGCELLDLCVLVVTTRSLLRRMRSAVREWLQPAPAQRKALFRCRVPSSRRALREASFAYARFG